MIATENRTGLHTDTVCALLSSKLNCDRSAAGIKPSKVELNAAKKALSHTNIIKPQDLKVGPHVKANA